MLVHQHRARRVCGRSVFHPTPFGIADNIHACRRHDAMHHPGDLATSSAPPVRTVHDCTSIAKKLLNGLVTDSILFRPLRVVLAGDTCVLASRQANSALPAPVAKANHAHAVVLVSRDSPGPDILLKVW
eukprot:scaffold126121_cov32-Prasinocladus_malaysianus.AAC.1